MLKRSFLAAALSTVLVLGGAAVASADDWCTSDPAVRITTPAGHTLVVKVTDYGLGTQHLDALRQATYTYTATPRSGGGTDVVLSVLIPGDVYNPTFQTRSVVSSAADENSRQYQVYADNGGVSGTAIVHTFPISLN